MRFKKIYIEITNVCNLKCSFCIGNKRIKKYMSIEEFNVILDKIDGYTDYIYLHLMGDSLMHPLVNDFINIASKRFNINITTNGYLINKIVNNKNIRQINISLHSYDPKYNVSLDNYLNNIFNTIKTLDNTYVSLRIWTNNKYKDDILKYIEDNYQVKINSDTKINDYLFVNFDKEFIWPDINNNYENINGTCMGLRTHLGILCDGSVVPCCLDYNGQLILGNIFEDDLSNILNKKIVKEMIDGFESNKKIMKLCQHCNFYDRISAK